MSLSQPNDSMFERNIAIIASRKQEVLVDSDGVLYQGFLCGMDQQWLQIYGHDQADALDKHLAWRFVLINRDRINTIRTSGKDIYDYPDNKEWIEKRVASFSSIASKQQVRKQEQDDDR